MCIGSCDVAMCRWITWPELSSLAGFSTRSQAWCCIAVLSGYLDLWHILMHWLTFRLVKVRTRVRRLGFDGLARANPHGLIFHSYRILRLMQICFFLCWAGVLRWSVWQLTSTKQPLTQVTGHRQTSHVWLERSESVAVGSTQRDREPSGSGSSDKTRVYWHSPGWAYLDTTRLLKITCCKKKTELWTANVICVQVWENVTNRRQKINLHSILYSVRVAQRTQFPSIRKTNCVHPGSVWYNNYTEHPGTLRCVQWH